MSARGEPRPALSLSTTLTDEIPESELPSASPASTGLDGASRRRRPPRRTRRAILVAEGAVVVVLAVYAQIFVRGLWWQWQAVFTQGPAKPPQLVLTDQRSGSASRSQSPAASSGQVAPAPQPERIPLAPTDEPPPRDTTDRYGVYYDRLGVGVMGLIADPNGVYNVPPGRQVRIGGPGGELFDVLPGGKLAPAKEVREQPR